MTRAKERLVIAGTQGRNKIPDGCWYQLVEDALTPDCVAEPADDGDGEVLRYRKGRAAARTAGTNAVAGQRSKPSSAAGLADANAAPKPRRAHRHAVERRGRGRPPARRRRPRGGAAARLAGAPAAAVAAGYSRRTTREGGGRIISPAPATNCRRGAREDRRASHARARGSALLRAVTAPAAGPKFRSSEGLSSAAKPCASPARSTAWR